MNVRGQCLAHLPSSNVRDRVQSQAIVEFIVIIQVLPNAIDDKMQKFVLLVQEEGDRKVTDLFLGVFRGRDKVQRFEVAEVDVPSQDIYVQQLGGVRAGC